MAAAPKVPKYCLHKPSGRAYVRVSRKAIYLGEYGSPESHAAYSRVVSDVLAGRPVAPHQRWTADSDDDLPRLTVGELVAKYRTHCKSYYRKGGKPTSEVHIVKSATDRLIKQHGNLLAREFKRQDLKVVRDGMVEEGLCRRVINQYVGRIAKMFRWGAEEELVPLAVAQAVSTLKGLEAERTDAPDYDPVEPVDDDVVDATLPYLPEVVKSMVELQRATGCRPTEVCIIRPKDVDRTGDVWVYRPASHKTQHRGKRRIVLIGPRGQEILRPYLLRPEDEYCFRPARHVAIPRKFKRYRNDSYRRAIVRACELAKITPHWTPNQLRHTAATVVRKQFGLEAAQILLGHSRADITQVYAERDVAKGIEVARAIG